MLRTYKVRLILLFFTVLSNHTIASGAEKCSDILSSIDSTFQKYEKVIPPARTVKLSEQMTNVLLEFRQDSADMTGYLRYGKRYVDKKINGNDKSKEIYERLGITVESLVEEIEMGIDNSIGVLRKFPKYKGYVFRSVLVDKTNELHWLSVQEQLAYVNKMEALEQGDVLEFPEFLSSSKRFEVANRLHSINYNRIVFVMKSKNGIDLSNHAGDEFHSIDPDNNLESTVPSHEVIFLPKSKFKVVKKMKSFDRNIKLIVIVEEV